MRRCSANCANKFLFVFKHLEGLTCKRDLPKYIIQQNNNLSTILIWQFDLEADNNCANSFYNVKGITCVGELSKYITHKNNCLF